MATLCSTRPPLQRLPVNPRRRKIGPSERKRVARACNNCNVRRIKCSGQQPCNQCANFSRECVYQSPEYKVTITREEYDELQNRCAHLQQCLDGVSSSPQGSLKRFASVISGSQLPDDARLAASDTILANVMRYLGESSDAAFLVHLRDFMNTLFPITFNNAWPTFSHPETTYLRSLDQCLSYDSQPVCAVNGSPHVLLSRTEASIMFADLRYFAQDGSGDFASGGIYYWGNLDALLRDYHGHAQSKGEPSGHGSIVASNAALALAGHINPTGNLKCDSNIGGTFFARARTLMGNPLDVGQAGDASALALMGFYLLGMNRRDTAYMYISVAMHICIVHGVHLGWMADESAKRIFWTIYILDRSISCLMGRPTTVTDEAITIDLPQDTGETPPACGIRAHIQLCRISDHIVSNIYGVARRNSGTTTTAQVELALTMLANWLANLPPALRIQGEGSGYDRSCCQLHMAYNQLLIVTLRPVLLAALKKTVADRYLQGQPSAQEPSHITYLHTCSEAARRNLRLGRWILELGRSPRLLQADIHHIFNAGVILELNQLLLDKELVGDTAEVIFATTLLQSDACVNSDYAKECSTVLLDLCDLTRRIRGQEHPILDIRTSSAPPFVPSGPDAHMAAVHPSHPLAHGHHGLIDWLATDGIMLDHIDV